MSMHVEVFRHRVAPGSEAEFGELYAQMVSAVSELDGYMGHKVFTADDGERVLIGYFADRETVETWDRHPEHKRAKERGRQQVFTEYDVVVAEVVEHHRKVLETDGD